MNTDSGGSSENGGKDAGSGGEMSSGGMAGGGSGNMGGSSAGGVGGGTAGMSGGAGKGTGGSSGPTDEWWSHNFTDKASGVTCETAGVPKDSDRVSSDPGDNLPPIYLAMYRFRIGAVDEKPDPNHPGLTYLPPNPDAWKDIGFDLDASCTRSATCQIDDTTLVDERACGANSSTVPFDGNKCIDNSVGKLFNIAATAPSVGEWFGLTENDWNCELWRGGFSYVFKISNYNGEPNDDSVKVDMYWSTGLQTLPLWSCRTAIDQPLAMDWNTHALWPTKAHWIISEDAISPSADQIGTEVKDAKAEDIAAYVRGGWLVAHFPDGSWLWLDGERTPVPGFREIMHRSVMAVKLVQDKQTSLWSMDEGTLGLVALPGEMLDGFAQLGFCDNMCGTLDTVKDYLNTQQDSLSTDSNAPPDTKCNALSYAHVFKAAQITADMNDVKPTKPFTTCPQPAHPAAPRQGCVCSADRSKCTLPDGGL